MMLRTSSRVVPATCPQVLASEKLRVARRMEDKTTDKEDAHELSFVIASFPGLSAEGLERLKPSNPQRAFEEAPQQDRCTLAVSAGIWFGLQGSGVDIKAFEHNKHLEKQDNLYQFKYPMSGDVGTGYY